MPVRYTIHEKDLKALLTGNATVIAGIDQCNYQVLRTEVILADIGYDKIIQMVEEARKSCS